MTPTPLTPRDLLEEVETLPPEWGLVILDRALLREQCRLPELIEEAQNRSPGTRWLVTIADARASTSAQSILRYAWYCADLPTPSLKRRLPTPHGSVHAVCATDYHRFAITTEASAEQRVWLASRGWHVLVAEEGRVRSASVHRLIDHIRAEHLHHLATVGLGGRHDLLTA